MDYSDDEVYLEYSDEEEYLDDIDRELKSRGFDISRLSEETKELLIAGTVQSWRDIAQQPLDNVLYVIKSGLLHQRACDVIIESMEDKSCLEDYQGSYMLRDVIQVIVLSIRDLESLKSMYMSTVLCMEVLEDKNVLSMLVSSWMKHGTSLKPVYLPYINTFSDFVRWIESNYFTKSRLRRCDSTCARIAIKTEDLDSWEILVDNGYIVTDDDFVNIVKSPSSKRFGDYYMRYHKFKSMNMVFTFGSVDEVRGYVVKNSIFPLRICDFFLLRSDFTEYTPFVIEIIRQYTKAEEVGHQLPTVHQVMDDSIRQYRTIHGPRARPHWLLYFSEDVYSEKSEIFGHRRMLIRNCIRNIIYT